MALMVTAVLITVVTAWVVHTAIKLMEYVQVDARFHGPALDVTRKKVTMATIQKLHTYFSINCNDVTHIYVINICS